MIRALILLLMCLPVWATDHIDARIGIIQLHTQTVGTGSTVLVGDSNTEGFWWTTIGPCNIINAGVGGANLHDVAQHANEIAAITLPKHVHIMLGSNDLYGPLNAAQVRADIATTIRAFKSRGAQVIWWPVPPFAEGWMGINSVRLEFNAIAMEVSGYNGVWYDWYFPTTIGGDGYAPAATMTPDKVHFSRATQVARWYRIEVWRAYIFAQTGVNGC